MANWHLRELRNELERKGWRIVAEHPGNDRDLSGSWEIQRSPLMPAIHIDFEGLDDLDTLPVTESYGCHVREQRSISLYFGRHGESGRSNRRTIWKSSLRSFVDSLNAEIKQKDHLMTEGEA